MTCDRVRDMILEGKLSDFGRKHLEKCPECSSLLTQVNKLEKTATGAADSIALKERSADDFIKILDLGTNKRRKTFLAAAAMIIALIILPVASPTIARYVPFLDYFPLRHIRDDPGLAIGIERAPIIDESFTKNGITFTVHQVVADATRTIVIYRIDDLNVQDEYHEDEVRFNEYQVGSIRLDDIIVLSTSGVTTQTGKGQYVGIVNFNKGLDLQTITVVATDIGGIPGEWAVDVPLTRIDIKGQEEVTYDLLKTDKLGFEFTAVELTLGSTATYLQWVFLEKSGSQGEYKEPNVGFENKYFSYLRLWSLLTNTPEFILGDFSERIFLVDKNGNKIEPIEVSGSTMSGYGYFPPVKNKEGLKVAFQDVLLQNKEAVTLRLERDLEQWSATPFEKAGTTVTLECVNVEEDTTKVTLLYQYGQLGEMLEPYLVDDKENRYEFLNMELSMPSYDELADFMENMQGPDDGLEKKLKNFAAGFQGYKKYQTLFFESIPEDVETLRLVFEGVYFRSDEVWEVEAK